MLRFFFIIKMFLFFKENRSMLPLAAANVKKSIKDLKFLIESNSEKLKETEQWTKAQNEISLAKNICI